MHRGADLIERHVSVLLIGSQPESEDRLRALLDKAAPGSFILTAAASPDAVQESLAQHTVDIVLLDLPPHRETALDALEHLLNLAPSLPVVVLTDRVEADIGLELIRAGAQDYLVESGLDPDLLARSLVYAIERRRVREVLNRTNRAFRVLSECSQAQVRAEDEMALARRVCEVIVTTGEYVRAWIGYVEPDSSKLIQPVAWAGRGDEVAAEILPTWDDSELGQGPSGRALRTGRPSVVRVDDAGFAPWRERAQRLGYRSVISLPLLNAGKPLGVLIVCAAESDAFDLQEVQLLSELAGDLAYGLTAQRLRAQSRESEVALRESEARYHGLFDNLPVGVVSSTAGGTLLDVNQAFVEMAGYPDLETLMEAGTEALDTGANQARRLIDALGPGDSVHNYPLTLRRRDGTLLHTESNIRVIRGPDGQPQSYEAVLVDVTERNRAEAAEREQRALADGLRDTAAVLNSTLDLDEVLDRILDSVGKVVPHDRATIRMISGGVVEMVRQGGSGDLVPIDLRDVSIDLDDSPLTRRIVDTRVSLAVPDTASEPDWIPVKGREWVRSYAVAPIVIGGEVIGSLSLSSREPGFFTQAHADRLGIFANQAAVAIQNARLYNDALRRRRAEEVLRRAGAALISTLDLDRVLDILLEHLRETVPYNVATVQRVEGDKLVVWATAGFEEPRRHVGETLSLDEDLLIGRVIRSRQPVSVANIARDEAKIVPLLRTYAPSEVASWVGVPLLAGDDAIGVITLGRREEKPFTADEIDLLTTFTAQASFGVQNALLYQQLERQNVAMQQAVRERTSELQQAKEHVETILNNSPDALLMLGTDGTIQNVSPAFYGLFCYSSDEMFGEPLTRLVEDHYAGAIQQALDNARRDLQPQRLEVTARRCDGTTFDADMALAPIREGGDTLLGHVCSLRDITAFKSVERMKDTLISTAAHELRTPLTSIQGYSELLLTRQFETERQVRYLTFINKQATQLAAIVENLLDLARLEAGRGMELSTSAVSLSVMAGEIIAPFVEAFPLHRFALDIPADLPLIFGDRTRVMQVLRNLVSNAVKYSPQGGSVTVRAEHIDSMVCVRVIDEGIGMTPEQMSHLFERFFRADTSNTAVGGTGLGLTVCKLIVELHGGTISVESEYGTGSVFSFTLPIVRPDNPPD